MHLQIDLNDDQGRRLTELAQEYGVAPERLAKSAIETMLAGGADDFRKAADEVLQKNHELYKRLS